MNLYKVIFEHYAPRDCESGIKEYLLADNQEQVFDYINKKYNHDYWDDNYITKEERLMKKGQIQEHGISKSDLYYGWTEYGWELVKENIETNLLDLIKLKVISKIN